MSREPTFESTALRRQFKELATLTDDDLTVYLIGGGALTLEELKNAMKDISSPRTCDLPWFELLDRCEETQRSVLKIHRHVNDRIQNIAPLLSF